MRVVVLHDSVPSDAREDQLDTLVQARAVRGALTTLGHDVHELEFTADLAAARTELSRCQPDVVFNLVESVDGCGRLLYLAPALLDAMRLRYTGAPTEAIFVTTDKLLAKRWLAAHAQPTPPWWSDSDGLVGQQVPLPADFIFKGVHEEASVGIDDEAVIRVPSSQAFEGLAAGRGGFVGDETFAELYVDGREFNLSVLEEEGGPRVLPPAEIRFTDFPAGKPRIVNYAAKWIDNSFEYHHTPRSFDFAPSDGGLVERLRELAQACWRLFGLKGYARVDFRVDQRGQPWILEINANPCISPDAGFVAAADRAGIDYRDLIRRIVSAAGARVPAGRT